MENNPKPDIEVVNITFQQAGSKTFKSRLDDFSRFYNRKIKTPIMFLAVAFLTFGLVAGTALVQRSMNTNTRAAGVTLSFSTTNPNPKLNDTFVVDVILNTNSLLASAADLKISYDATKLRATNLKPLGSMLPVVLTPSGVSYIDSVNGKAKIALGCLVDQTAVYPKSGTDVLAEISFTAIATGSANISFDSSSIVTVTTNESGNAVGTLTPITINITGSPTSIPASATPVITTTTVTITPPGTTEINIEPSDDAYVSMKNTGNIGSSTDLVTSDYYSDNIRYSYMKFNLSSLAGKTVKTVTLNLTPNLSRNAGKDVKLTADTWTEGTINWSNKPEFGAKAGSFNGSVTSGVPISIVLDSSLVQTFAGKILSIGIDNQGTTDTLQFYSKEIGTANYHPNLVIKY